MNKNRFNILTGSPLPVFIYYAVPSVVGMLAISSAWIVDGYFLGNYVGSRALAAVNLVMPVLSLIVGLGVMLSAGGAVRCGKYNGEGRTAAANAIFTKTLIAVTMVCLALTLAGYFFMDRIIPFLGADDELAVPVREYLSVIMAFPIFYAVGICLANFVRIDSRPVLASVAFISGAFINMVLDWLLVAHAGWGIRGAALATGASTVISLFILSMHFLSSKSRLKLTSRLGEWTEIYQAAYNGMSEFINEISTGVVIMVFNWEIMRYIGTDGVAAFTIINYLLFAEITVIIGIGESLQPIISTNFGARKAERINAFLKISSACIAVLSLISILLLKWRPEMLVGLFLDAESGAATRDITLAFAMVVWPAFIVNGYNIMLSAYFTAVHKALPSAIVAFSRSLILPILFLMILPEFFDEAGIYASIPTAELATFCIALYLFRLACPKRVIEEGA